MTKGVADAPAIFRVGIWRAELKGPGMRCPVTMRLFLKLAGVPTMSELSPEPQLHGSSRGGAEVSVLTFPFFKVGIMT